MTVSIYKALAACIIFIVTIAAAAYPLRRQRAHVHFESLHLGEALASGIFLGAAFFHMLPDAIRIFANLYGTVTYPIPELICILGFLTLLFLERVSLSTPAKNTIPYILALTLIIHALTEGAALGVSINMSETIMLFIAILAHKASESFALCITLLRHEIPFKRIIAIVILFACMTPLGIGFGTAIDLYAHITNGQLIGAIINAFAAGTFLYISTLHHVHFHQHREDKQGMLEFGSLIAGVATMGIIALWT